MEADGHWRSLRGDIDAYCFSVRGVRSARHGEQPNCNRAEPDVRTCKETSRWCDRSILDVRQSVDPTGRKVAGLSGARVAETILAAFICEHNASDLIKSMQRQSCKEGAVHIWGPDADRRAKLLICLAVKGSGRLFTGWGLHPLESAAFARRTRSGHSTAHM